MRMTTILSHRAPSPACIVQVAVDSFKAQGDIPRDTLMAFLGDLSNLMSEVDNQMGESLRELNNLRMFGQACAQAGEP